jgi:peroxiredoxin
MMRIARLVLLSLALAPLALATPQTAQVGQPAPEFSALDETGARHALSEYRGKIVVLEWTNPDCPYVARHYKHDTMETLAKRWGARGVVWLAVNSTHTNRPADTLRWKQEQGFAYPTLQDSSGEIGRLYGARNTPHMFIIDAQGELRYSGAIDDDPRGRSAQPHNFVDAGLSALLAGNVPDPSTTQPYGCSVKYR